MVERKRNGQFVCEVLNLRHRAGRLPNVFAYVFPERIFYFILSSRRSRGFLRRLSRILYCQQMYVKHIIQVWRPCAVGVNPTSSWRQSPDFCRPFFEQYIIYCIYYVFPINPKIINHLCDLKHRAIAGRAGGHKGMEILQGTILPQHPRSYKKLS